MERSDHCFTSRAVEVGSGSELQDASKVVKLRKSGLPIGLLDLCIGTMRTNLLQDFFPNAKATDDHR